MDDYGRGGKTIQPVDYSLQTGIGQSDDDGGPVYTHEGDSTNVAADGQIDASHTGSTDCFFIPVVNMESHTNSTVLTY